jgi:ATP-dependent helicase/nuclease subunit A
MAGTVSAPPLFLPDAAAASAAEFGSQVHALLAGVEWAESPRPADGSAHGLPAPVVAEALACLEAPALTHVWRRPVHGEVWCERAFEIVLDGAWVAGVFDRVVIEREASGEVRGVAVYDFKTDAIDDNPESLSAACQRHTAQLNVYRRVAAVLTGQRPEQVRCELVFTKLRRAAAVRAG